MKTGAQEMNQISSKLDYQLANILSAIIERFKTNDQKEVTAEEIKEFVKKHEDLLKG